MRSSFVIGFVFVATSFVTARWSAAQDPAAKAGGANRIQIKASRDLLASPSTMANIRLAMESNRARGSEPGAATHVEEEVIYAMLSMEFTSAATCQAFNLPGHKLITRFDKFADVFVRIPPAPAGFKGTLEEEVNARLNAMRAQMEQFKGPKGLVWFEEEEFTVPPPARPIPSKERSRAAVEKIAQGGAGGLTGKGVIIAIVDTGVDFRHPDFITTDAQGQPVSRLLYFWDTGSDSYANGIGEPAPYSYPNGAPIGTIYDRKTMTDDIKGGKLRIPVWDTNGHGTACASVAAGNGRASPNYKGVAQEADLIAVRIGSGDVNNMAFENSYLLNAICEWLDKKAASQPLVVSCSFGGPGGGHDGQRVTERHLSARFSLDRKGRALCISAGNGGRDAQHAPMLIGPQSKPAQITWSLPVSGRLAIYIQNTKDDDIAIDSLRATELSDKNVKSYINPLMQQLVIEIDVGAVPGGLQIVSKSGATYTADAYLIWKGFMPFRDGPAGFSRDCVDSSKQIGSPGAALNALTVGSYDWNDLFDVRGTTMTLSDPYGDVIEIGKLSSYSNPGPVRYGGAVKPEIVAPGQWYAAAAPLNVNPNNGRDGTNHYQRMNGTSAATPFAAGVIALMFQKAPALAWGEARKILIASVTKNAITGTCPNPHWGYGKLDLAAVENALAGVKK